MDVVMAGIKNREASIVYEFTMPTDSNPATMAKVIATEILMASHNIGGITREKPPSNIECFAWNSEEKTMRIVVQWSLTAGRDDINDEEQERLKAEFRDIVAGTTQGDTQTHS